MDGYPDKISKDKKGLKSKLSVKIGPNFHQSFLIRRVWHQKLSKHNSSESFLYLHGFWMRPIVNTRKLTRGILPLSDPLHTFRRSSQGGIAWPKFPQWGDRLTIFGPGGIFGHKIYFYNIFFYITFFLNFSGKQEYLNDFLFLKVLSAGIIYFVN